MNPSSSSSVFELQSASGTAQGSVLDPVASASPPPYFGITDDEDNIDDAVRSAPQDTTDLNSGDLDQNPRFHVFRFHSQILPDDRDIFVHLPPQYLTEPGRHFPVFYLHDGQNLFDGRLSYVAGRTWRAHSTADALTQSGRMEPVILVGIANTGLRRMAEYTPTRDFKMGGGEGRSYGRLILDELKPQIDSSYRTLPESEHTALGGSSLGGLISLYLALQNRDRFGRIAVMSPSIWWDHRSILSYVDEAVHEPALRIWLDMGTAEGLRHLRDTDLLYRTLRRKGWQDGADLAYMRVEGGVHDEDAWAARFGRVLAFLFPPR